MIQTRNDREGATTSFTYDFTNRITTVAAPEGRDWTYDYDPFGRVTEITDPLDQNTQVVWTADHKVDSVTEPGGAVSTFEYNANGYLTERVDPEGGVTQLSYDDLPVDSNDVADNPAEVLRTYELTEDVTLYFGRVAGGEGNQALIPRGIDPGSILRQVGARPL